MKTTKYKPDLSSFAEKDFFLLDATRLPDGNLAVAYTDKTTDGFLIFDGAGKLTDTHTISYTNDYQQLFYSEINCDATKPYWIPDYIGLHSLETDHTVLCFGKTMIHAYQLDDDRIFQLSQTAYAEEGSRTAAVYEYTEAFVQFPPRNEKSHLALLYEEGAPIDWMYLDGREISPMFGVTYDEPELASEFICTLENDKLTAIDNMRDVTLAVDFASNTADVSYDIKPEHLEEQPFATSPDSKYSLYSSSMTGMGDVAYASLVLRNNSTGELRYLGQSGGMYGGYGQAGFFNNGDIYTMSMEHFRIFAPSGERMLAIEEQFPLGSQPEEQIYRMLLAVRRNPEDKTFWVVYADCPFDAENAQEQNSFLIYPYNYRIGYCDETGKLLESWDTGSPVLGTYFGISDVSLRLSDSKLSLRASGGKGDDVSLGVFDTKEKTFEPAE